MIQTIKHNLLSNFNEAAELNFFLYKCNFSFFKTLCIVLAFILKYFEKFLMGVCKFSTKYENTYYFILGVELYMHVNGCAFCWKNYPFVFMKFLVRWKLYDMALANRDTFLSKKPLKPYYFFNFKNILEACSLFH